MRRAAIANAMDASTRQPWGQRHMVVVRKGIVADPGFATLGCAVHNRVICRHSESKAGTAVLSMHDLAIDMVGQAGSNPAGSSRPLRVGLLVDSLSQPAWVKSMIDDVVSSGFAEITLVVRNASPTMGVSANAPKKSRLARWYENRSVLLFALYERLDARKFTSADDPLRLVDVAPTLADVPVIDVVPRETRFSDYFEDADVDRILAHDVDVALRLGFRILRGRALQIARHGVWSYHHGDNFENRGGPPGFWEVMNDEPTTGAVLQILSEDLDAGRVIYRSQAATSRYSVTKNRHGYFWKASTFVIRKLRDLYEEGSAALTDPDPNAGAPVAYSRRLYLTPGNSELSPYLGRLATRYAREKIRERTGIDQWQLAYRFAPGTASGDVPDMTPFRFRSIVPPADRLWADPFPLHIDGKYYVLYEELEFNAPKGRICGIELNEKGPVGQPVRVLERPYHLSYPYTFEWGGELYMIPESVANKSVDLFRAVKAPYEWVHDRTLLEGVALVDATVVEIDGRWWMFAGAITRGGSRGDELNLYYADTPVGPWIPHRRNPVISDVRHARPAGRPFKVGESWYRPAQDGSRRYGYAVALRKIIRLDEREFVEETVSRLTPDWDRSALATHTINAVDGLTVIDVQRRRRG